MNILIIGSGAREHAIARALHKSPKSKFIYCLASNNNPGIKKLCYDMQVIDINNNELVVQYSKKNNISLAIIGPENPLANGIVDMLGKAGVQAVGPTKEMAKIEASKSFARDLLLEYNIPACPKYKVFKSTEGVKAFLTDLGEGFVVKYDGLAGGKGVKVSGDHLNSHEEAMKYCDEIIQKGGKFVVEEKLVGEEFSLMSFSDGKTLIHMPAIQDHKRALDGDLGPNTGGMGTYSAANHSLPFLNKNEVKKAQEINSLTAAALKKKFGYGYKGILYGGFIATSNGVKLIEYNARFGDPEAMNVLSLLQSDFVDICTSIANSNLKNTDISFLNKASVCKYAVPNGYPNKPIKGKEINVDNVFEPDMLFYASVTKEGDRLILAGSRAVAVVAVEESISEAEKVAENEICSIKGPLFHRKDIGKESLIQNRINHMKSIR